MNHILAPADIAHYYSRLAQPSTLPAAAAVHPRDVNHGERDDVP